MTGIVCSVQLNSDFCAEQHISQGSQAQNCHMPRPIQQHGPDNLGTGVIGSSIMPRYGYHNISYIFNHI